MRLMTVDECVEAGIARLDADRPGWWKDFDEGTLDLKSGTQDVLGKVYGSFFIGLHALGLYWTEDWSGVRFGFIDAMASDERKGVARSSIPELTRAWVRKVGERRRRKGAA